MFFNYNGIDRRTVYLVLLALAVFSILSMSSGEKIYLLLSLPAVLIAVSFHEFAHAYTAVKYGDTTPKNQGRLTVNPKAHLDWFGFFLMMFAHIGWGKPVQINPNNFNSNKSRGYCEMMVALAGPMMNFFLAIISCVAYIFCAALVESTNILWEYFLMFLQLLMTMNVGLCIFNLIPLPPLDGEKIFEHFLPYKAKEWILRNYNTLYFIFMILWFFGFLEIIVSPVIGAVTNAIFQAVSYIIGLIL